MMTQLNKIVFLCILILCVQKLSFAQNTDSTLPSVSLKNIKGQSINISEITNGNKPILICFWKTCCKSPCEYLDAVAEVYEDWVDETGVVLYAVAIDNTRSSSRVAPFANSHGWGFEVLLDPNSELKRAMNVALTPHTFLLNGKGEIVWQKTLYVNGDEDLIYEQIEKVISE
ncbi:MAG: TlpA family protein disulfide reductase [Salinivirgaceae bacterium]|nr:TlpA family protein disulfide reductase [Salinivirgaceae bacterium]